eukprot:TRINITY_DN17407_c0_g1_i3.p3 TRINITY_DN17407_c0_g1~~TRINITY_DN17407_c0_g1_i3.p3  ORF type:complete len:116 (-),score=8.77 TRINITY_DN17407_c0_g1_i3:212-508(-)
MHMAWCSNGMIVGALGTELHFINGSGTVTERIPDAHMKQITCLRETSGPVKCGSAKECVVVSGGIDMKVRVWAVPAQQMFVLERRHVELAHALASVLL